MPGPSGADALGTRGPQAEAQDGDRPRSEVELVVRQVRAIDAWNRARRRREEQLTRPESLSREARMDVSKRLSVDEEVQRAMQEHVARGLAAERPGTEPRAVIAHRQPWFVTTMTSVLAGCGIRSVSHGENGAVALGVVVAEQPDLLLVGDVLAMLSTRELIAEAAVFAPRTRVVVQVPDTQHERAMRAAGAHAVHARRVAPAVIGAQVASLLGRDLQTAST